jgi:nicotinate-nucleotide adenylyltransferase
VQGIGGFEVSDIEQQRGGPIYTIETARELKRQGWDRVSWLVGADMVQILPMWREPEALLREVDFVLMARPGWRFDWEKLPSIYRPLEKRVVETPLIEISATQIRQRVEQGQSIDFLTPPPVVRYIHDYGLYRGSRASA